MKKKLQSTRTLPQNKQEEDFQIGDLVKKTGGDYSYRGVVVSAFTKWKSDKIRIVVENEDGMLFIFNPAQLERVG